MVKRYAHHSADSMRKFTGQIDAVLGSATEATQKTDAPLLKLVG